jgi:hypothetical protein
MRIRVLCSDKSRGYVEDNKLHDLIEKGIVVAFFRPGSNEWVDARKNNIRKSKNNVHRGPGEKPKT